MPFKDPTLPDEYSPYNIQAIGDSLCVMYAKLKTDEPERRTRSGRAEFGYVSVFSTDGTFGRRFASQGTLNIPWGVTIAPSSFLQDQDIYGGGTENGGYGTKSSTTGSNTASEDNRHLNEPVIPGKKFR